MVLVQLGPAWSGYPLTPCKARPRAQSPGAPTAKKTRTLIYRGICYIFALLYPEDAYMSNEMSTSESEEGDVCEGGPFDMEQGVNVYASYDVGKAHFEDVLHFAQIKGANAYYHEKWDGDFVLETESGIQQMFRNLYFLFSDEVLDKNGAQTGGTVLRKGIFVQRWLKDPKKKEYTDIKSDPDCKDGTFKNIWPGFRAEQYSAIDDRLVVEQLSAPIVEHLRGLLYNVEEHVSFVLKWLAFQVRALAA